MTNENSNGHGAAVRNGRTGNGPRETVNLAANLRDFFDDFETAAWRARGSDGTAGIAARRRLIAALEATEAMIPNVKALLQAEIVDAIRALAAAGGAPPEDKP
jgi:hypothetical protein